MDAKRKRKERRVRSIRKKVSGTADRPRLCVHKSNKNIYMQIIDDVGQKTLCGFSTGTKEKKDAAETKKNMTYAAKAGETIAKIAVEKGITKVVFDRAGYRYHGVIKALADAARKGGLQF